MLSNEYISLSIIIIEIFNVYILNNKEIFNIILQQAIEILSPIRFK